MYKNNYPLYEMDSEENHFNRDDSNLYEEDRTRWIVEVAKNQLNKLDTFNISRNKSIKRNNEDNIQSHKTKIESETPKNHNNSSEPSMSILSPVFIDPSNYLDVKQETESQPDLEEFPESHKVESLVTFIDLKDEVDNDSNSSYEENPDDFEFVPPPKKRKRKSYPYVPKNPKPRRSKAPEIPSNMEEVLTDPTRLPGGFKKGRYKIRSLTGVPYCKFCDKVFMNRKEKQAHVCQYLQCADPKNYICRVCNKELSKQSFSSHYHDAAGCQYCGKKFLNPRDIKEHIENVHKGEEYKPPVITSSEIEKYVQKKIQEEGHIYEQRAKILAKNLEHTGPKVHTCNICQESFRNPRSLERHSRIHTDLEKFSCEFCGKITFSKSNLLKHHQWVHKIPKLRENKKRKKLVENELEKGSESVEDNNETEYKNKVKRGRKKKSQQINESEIDNIKEKISRNSIESWSKDTIESEDSSQEVNKGTPPRKSQRTRKATQKILELQRTSPEHSSQESPENYEEIYEDFDPSESLEQLDDLIEDETEYSNDFESQNSPITKIKTFLKQPSTSLLPGNIKPGRYKIRNCTGVPFCKFCDTIFANRKEKQTHDCEFLKCDPKNFICRVCRKELSRQSFSSHVHETAGCQYCGKKILNPKDMKSHIAAKHRYEEYKPPLKIDENIIEEYIQQKLDKEAHVYELREQKKPKNKIIIRKRRKLKFYTCDMCGEQSETKKQIELHISTHVITIYKCNDCDEMFETKSAYKNHRIQHSLEIVTYHCDFCGKNFNTKENIRTHQKNIHGYGLKCEVCKIPLESKEEMLNHMREEHGELPCRFCGKMFLIPSKLKSHEIRHMVQAESKPSSKSYVCQYCKESFYNSTALNYHLRFHGACEWLTCEYCGKNFPTSVNLKTHQARKHQIGISCEVCKLEVQSKEELKDHMLLTHGSFECEICYKSFVGPSKLKAHLRTHTKAEHDGIRVECNYCPRKFLPSRVRNHMFKFHNEKFNEWLASTNNSSNL